MMSNIDVFLQLVFQSLSTLPDDKHVYLTLIVNEPLLILLVRAIRILSRNILASKRVVFAITLDACRARMAGSSEGRVSTVVTPVANSLLVSSPRVVPRYVTMASLVVQSVSPSLALLPELTVKI
jgi:hypothetical protein